MTQKKTTASAAEILRQRFEAAHNRKTTDIAVPGIGGLQITFRAITDWGVLQKARRQLSNDPTLKDEDKAERASHITLLNDASVECFLLIDGKRHEIVDGQTVRLGGELFAAMYPEGLQGHMPENDFQATTLLFRDNTLALGLMFEQLMEFSLGLSADDSDEELMADFPEASSSPA